MAKIQKSENGWSIVSSDGGLIQDGMSNAQAWRALDLLQHEYISASEASQSLKEPNIKPTQSEMQDFMSGLVFIGQSRGYSDGWAWHKFIEKFGHTPEGLHRIPHKPSKSVWGWINRKAIKAEKMQ